MSKQSGKTRGVEHPIAEDMALIGDTRMPLHNQSLPAKYGPNYGIGKAGGGEGDQFRVEGNEEKY